MRWFIRFVNSLPLAGKMTIRAVVFPFYQSTTKEDRRLYYALTMALLAFLIVVHAVQALMGFQLAVLLHCPAWARAIGGVYALVNVSVVLVQSHLAFRVTRFLFKGTYPRRLRSYERYSSRDLLKMGAVTVIGQAVMLAVYFHYAL